MSLQAGSFQAGLPEAPLGAWERAKHAKRIGTEVATGYSLGELTALTAAGKREREMQRSILKGACFDKRQESSPSQMALPWC